MAEPGPLVVCPQGLSAKNEIGLSALLSRAYAGEAYLISMTTPESPRLLAEGATTSWFQVYLGEFNYLFRARRAFLAAGRRFGRSDHRGRGTRHRAVGACVAADTVHQSAVELNRLRDM